MVCYLAVHGLLPGGAYVSRYLFVIYVPLLSMGITTNLMMELNGASSALWAAMHEVEYLRTAPKWKNVTVELARAREKAAKARREITQLKRRYGIKKRGYAISFSDLPRK
jgi:hypothetical protein